MDLKAEVSKLVRLQEIDSRIYHLREEKNSQIPTQLEELKSEFEDRKKTLVSSQEKLKELQLKRKDKELDLASKEEGAKKAHVQLYQLKTNKEYQAKLSEIASIKADVSVLEEEVIEILEAIEEAEKKLNGEKNALSEEEEKLKNKKEEFASRTKDIEAEIKNLEDKRGVLGEEVDKKVLSIYEKLLNTRSGLAIVPVKNENCGACHMRVTPQTINEIKMYKDLVFCESCVRILYISEDIGEW